MDSSVKEEEEMKPLVKNDENGKHSLQKQKQKQQQSSHGYTVIPLIERNIWERLDVGPFAVIYILLVALDQQSSTNGETETNSSTDYTYYYHIATGVMFSLVLLCHLGIVLLQQWRISFQSIIAYRRAASMSRRTQWTHCLVQAPMDSSPGRQDEGIVPVTHGADHTAPVSVITYHNVVFRATDPSSTSTTASDGDDEEMDGLWKITNNEENDDVLESTDHSTMKSTSTSSFHRLRYPVDLPLSFYQSWTGHDTLNSVKRSHKVYGPNETHIQLPPFMNLLGEQLLAPFFLFQLLCVVLWSLDEYWYYAIFTLLALLLFESTVAFNRLKGLERLRNTLRHAYHVSVFRHHHWMLMRTDELVPGDIVSLVSTMSNHLVSLQQQQQQQRQHRGQNATLQHNFVPADVLLLQGSAVVDEALLTGESIPQRKGALDCSVTSTINVVGGGVGDASSSMLTRLDMQDPQHKESILFGGTILVSHESDDTSSSSSPSSLSLPNTRRPPPDQGILCMVLKTGFETTQGSLLRSMAHSSMKSGGSDGIHTKDTFVFVAILLCCAVFSAVMVLLEGWKDETRNRFRLLLHVIIICTSVVPPELPMELSLAVTNSVADLMRRCQVFCTEPYRIPWAGQVNVCCFDKTGTLTSDEMQLRGVRLLSWNESGLDDATNAAAGKEDELLHPLHHTLPWDILRVMVACQSLSIREHARGTLSTSSNSVLGDPLEKAVLRDTGYIMRGNNLVVAASATPETDGHPRGIFIHHRFAFSSRLKRMTVLLTEDNNRTVIAVTKGAPETIKLLLRKVPPKYDEVYQHHMKLGQRVLAMSYRSFGRDTDLSGLILKGRATVESDSIFAGFLVLDCPLKSDSKFVIQELNKSGHETVMITGDAVLTAAEVARQVGIIPKHCLTYELLQRKAANSNSIDSDAGVALNDFHFCPLLSDEASLDEAPVESIPLQISNMKPLLNMKEQLKGTFCVSGTVMSKLAVAILKHHNIEFDAADSTNDDKNLLLHPAVQSILKDVVQVIAVYARHAPRQKEAVVAAYNLAGKYTMMTGDGTNDVGALKRAHVGISIISAPELEAKQRAASDTIAKEQRKERKARKEGKAKNKNKRLDESLRQLQEAQNELDHVELGDASVASPFTSRVMSIKCCKDVLQQGRCTLVTMLTIYKILGVNCLVNALVLSKLHMHGVKQGDRQLTIQGLVVAALFFFVTRGKPLPTLSPTRPPSSVLCRQALLSIAAQFLVHFMFIMIVTDISLAFVDPYDPSIIPDASFNPNVLNTCTYLLTMVATINSFVVNYRGKPFMEDLKDNKMLLRSAQVCYVVLFACSLEVFPPLNDLFQIAPFPETQNDLASDDDWVISISQAGGLTQFVREVGFPVAMSLFMVADIALAFSVEKIILKIFP